MDMTGWPNPYLKVKNPVGLGKGWCRAEIRLQLDHDSGIELPVVFVGETDLGGDFQDQPVPEEALPVSGPQFQVFHPVAGAGFKGIEPFVADGLILGQYLVKGKGNKMRQAAVFLKPVERDTGTEKPVQGDPALDIVMEIVFKAVIGVVAELLNQPSLPGAVIVKSPIAQPGVEIIEGHLGADGDIFPY